MRCALELAIAMIVLAGACEGASADTEDSSSDDAGSDGSESGEPAWTSLAERPCPPESWLTWESFGAPFVRDYCSSCHGSGLPADMRQNAPVGLDFETLDQVRAHADRIWARAADANATMPPAGAPPRDQRAMLGEWLACGAPGDADAPR